MTVFDRETDWRGGACVLALGMFDGMHVGHRTLLEAAVGEARRLNVPCVACAFAGHPMRTLSPDDMPPQLTPGEEKAALMAAIGVDALLMRPFTAEFARLSPEAYIKLLVEAFMPVEMVVGYNHHFGAGGAGTPELLRSLGQRHGFTVRVVEQVCVDGEPVSASAIRAALAQGDVVQAARMLGRWYALTGFVVGGKRIGRALGFPTANIRQQPERALPRRGVYMAEVEVNGTATPGAPEMAEAPTWPEAPVASVIPFISTTPATKSLRARAVLNIGKHPTLPEGPPTIEAHLLDFDGDLYGEYMTLKLIGFLRGEQRFPDAQALRGQVMSDIEAARGYVPEEIYPRLMP